MDFKRWIPKLHDNFLSQTMSDMNNYLSDTVSSSNWGMNFSGYKSMKIKGGNTCNSSSVGTRIEWYKERSNQSKANSPDNCSLFLSVNKWTLYSIISNSSLKNTAKQYNDGNEGQKMKWSWGVYIRFCFIVLVIFQHFYISWTSVFIDRDVSNK